MCRRNGCRAKNVRPMCLLAQGPFLVPPEAKAFCRQIWPAAVDQVQTEDLGADSRGGESPSSRPSGEARIWMHSGHTCLQQFMPCPQNYSGMRPQICRLCWYNHNTCILGWDSEKFSIDIALDACEAHFLRFISALV